MDKVAFVLGGGSIKGAWQIGAVNNVISKGIYPDIITGISVGNLNGNLLASKVGEHYTNNPSTSVDWNDVSEYLKLFWFNKITSPNAIAYKKKTIKLIWELIRGRFNGFLDTSPLMRLINNNIHTRFLKNSKIKISSGCVNLEEGKIIYTDVWMSNYNKYVLASSVIPFMMPVEEIGTSKFVDGGLVDSAPIGKAIKMGATKIIVFANHPEKVGYRQVNHYNLTEYADRMMSVIVNNTLNNDITEAQLINELLKDKVQCKRINSKEVIEIIIIRPSKNIDLKLDDFNTTDIKKMYNDGWNKADSLKLN